MNTAENTKALLRKLVKRIKPQDGLHVNAQVWEEAHSYHRFHQQAHTLFGHGAGILTGLNVVAEPDSNRVWIEPGIAVDPQGQLIILEEQKSREITAAPGNLVYLCLEGTGEGDFETDPGGSRKAPQRVRDGYVIEQHLASIPASALELARITLAEPAKTINNAANPHQPALNELDLRFRRQIGVAAPLIVSMAICYAGSTPPPQPSPAGRSAGHLAQALNRIAPYRVCVDDNVTPEANLQPYTLIYVVQSGGTLPDKYAAALQTFLQNGGTVFIEYEQTDKPLPAKLWDIPLKPADDSLLVEPFLFGAPPPGATEGNLVAGDGLILSNCGYGHLWQGRQPDGQPASREKIRTALEWAANLLFYAANRRQRAAGPD